MTADGKIPKARIHHPYRSAAGGWDALASSFRHVREQGIVSLGALTLLKANQPGGFDCPGCAWPDRNPHSSFEFCENGVKAVAAEATRRRVGRELFARYTVSELAQQDDYWLESQGRLTEPMVYSAADDRYLPIGWDEAFALIGRQLRALASPDEALFYTSGRSSNEAAYLYQLFVRAYGTNNLPDCSNMCHEPSGVALKGQIGIGKGSVLLDDFEKADAIFIFGQNPGTNHPRMLSELRDAARRGARIVAFNPLRERGLERFANPQSVLDMSTGGSTRIATHYYQPRLGGDLAVVKGMIKCLLASGDVDTDFIAEHCHGFEALRAEVESCSWDRLVQGSGLSREQIEEAAEVYRGSQASIACWGMGITQHRHAVASIEMIVNLLLLRGNIGRPGAGVCPVRGHSNVQGDRSMGINEKPSAEFLDRLQQHYRLPMPRAHGHDVVGAIAAMHAGTARVFIALGGNFAAATPDTVRTAEALANCELTVQISTKLNRSHLVHGRSALILPCLGRTELDVQAAGVQGVSVEDSMSMVHLSYGMNPPASAALKSEPAIVAGIAAATLEHSAIPWTWLVEDYDRIRDEIAAVVPGFAQLNERLRQPGGFYLGNSARERRWLTASGRAEFRVHATPELTPAAGARFTLMTMRSHDQYNTTIYGMSDRYRGIDGQRRICFVNPADLRELNLSEGDKVDLVSIWDDGERRVENFAVVPYDIPRGCVGAYYPETNPLVPLTAVAERANTPTSKSIPLDLRPRSAQP